MSSQLSPGVRINSNGDRNSFIECSPDDLSGRSSAGSVAAVRPLVVVETKVALQRAIELAELREVATSSVTDMLESGVPVHVVQQHHGHQDSQTPLRYYAHAQEASLREAAERLARKRKPEAADSTAREGRP